MGVVIKNKCIFMSTLHYVIHHLSVQSCIILESRENAAKARAHYGKTQNQLSRNSSLYFFIAYFGLQLKEWCDISKQIHSYLNFTSERSDESLSAFDEFDA